MPLSRSTVAALLASADQGWYRLAQAEDAQRAADLHLYGIIGAGWWSDVDTSELVQQLADLDVDTINLRVNSPGGEVYGAVALGNALRRHQATVVATVDGLAASAATVVLMAADEIVMGRGAEMMVHDVWTGILGNADELRTEAGNLDRTSDAMARIYAERAGGTASDWRTAMKAETWYSADEAVTAGLADRVDGAAAPAEPDEAAAAWQTLHRYASRAAAAAPYVPTERAARVSPGTAILAASALLSNRQGRTNEPMEVSEMPDAVRDGLRERLGLGADVDDAALLAQIDERLAAPHLEPAVPGTVTVDATLLEQLRTDAAAGRQARDAQIRAERESLVDAAVKDGRIAPAGRGDWLAALENDPGTSMRDRLAAMAKNLIPVEAKGHTGGPDQADDESGIYARYWGDEKKGN
jgi:ATP-dependent protease ClpP protease subunit